MAAQFIHLSNQEDVHFLINTNTIDRVFESTQGSLIYLKDGGRLDVKQNYFYIVVKLDAGTLLPEGQVTESQAEEMKLRPDDE